MIYSCSINLTSKYQFFIIFLDMQKKRQPDPRFNQFTEVLDEEGKAIGFKIPNNDFLFKFDEDGGWVDEDDNYYNHEGILQSDSQDDDDDDISYSDRDDDLVDEFEDLLRREEQGVIRSPSHKQGQKKEEQQKETQKKEVDFKGAIQRYKNKELIRQNLPGELFIYFKQKSKYFEQIKPVVEKAQSIEEKNIKIQQIKKMIEEKRQNILKENSWIKEFDAILEYSGDSEDGDYYDRYWYGSIKITADKYLDAIEAIKKSDSFNLLTYKTFYALKSKFYLKKAEEKVKQHIKQLEQKVKAMKDEQIIEIKLENLPQNYPMSFVYDLVDFVGGKASQLEQVHAEDDFKAVVYAYKDTALKMINLQAYNHDKKQFIELQVGEKKAKASNPDKRFYFIEVEGEYKQHELELCDTLALKTSKQQLAKQLTYQQYQKSKLRFAVGSTDALKKVLMFRGPTLNTFHVLPKIVEQK